jgi:transcriptional regulator with XRE-family HTH domain
MGLTQVELGERLRVTGNTIARFERNEMAIAPPMELLIQYVAREASVEVSHPRRGRRADSPKQAKGPRVTHRQSARRKGSRKDSLR